MGFSEGETTALVVVRRTSSALNITGALFIIICYTLLKEARTPNYRLVLYLSVSALFSGIFDQFGNPDEGTGLCLAQAMGTTFFDMAIALWVMALATNVYVSVVMEYQNIGRLEKFYHILIWLTCLLVTTLPLSGDHYGNAGTWCWVRPSSWEWRLAILYIPLCFIFAYVVYVFTVTGLKVKRTVLEALVATSSGRSEADSQKEASSRVRKVLLRLGAYPLIFFVTWIFQFINRIQNAAAPDDPVFALYLLQAFFSPLVGFLNCIYFGIDLNVVRIMRGLWKKRQGRRAPQEKGGLIRHSLPPENEPADYLEPEAHTAGAVPVMADDRRDVSGDGGSGDSSSSSVSSGSASMEDVAIDTA